MEMESEGDEAFPKSSKRGKPDNSSQFPSTLIEDSSFEIPFLPEELIAEIISRLPVKQLLQLRCLSKSWLAFISTPQFVNTHLTKSAKNKEYTHHRLILRFIRPYYYLKDCSLWSCLYESDVGVSDFNCPMKNHGKSFRVVGSVNGLICLSCGSKDLFLWNPSIRKYKKLPEFRPKLRKRVIYGFGYDQFRDDYKVVGCGFDNSSLDKVEVKIYSLRSDSWRNVHYLLDGMRFFGWGKFVNGKLHWANSTGPDLYYGWNIISFDLADEKWEMVEQPCYEKHGDGVMVPVVLGNNLSVICNGNRARTNIDVWVMKEYGVKESWTKMFTVKCLHSPMRWLFNPPFLISHKDEILVMFGKNSLLYNLKDESIRYPKFTKFVSTLVAAIYVESLVSPLLQNDEHNRNDWCQS